ncbi:MAG: nitrate reductase associated protein [Myxococcota bacterium]
MTNGPLAGETGGPRGGPLPMPVRRRLEESGVPLTPTDWRRLPRIARRRLESFPVEDAIQRHAYADLVRWLQRTFLGLAVHAGAPPEAPAFPWRAAAAPAELERMLEAGEWARLEVDQRYALVRSESEARRRNVLAGARGLSALPSN